MSRLILVAHRLPVSVKMEGGAARVAPSVGGLATALGRVHAGTSTLWIGWAGHFDSVDGGNELVKKLASERMIAVDVPRTELARYYEGFSNGVLWPLLHYLIDKVNLDAEEDWSAYVAVNERFADAVVCHWREGDRIWIHDYQLALVPALLRQRLPSARIGFFLHVPFPAADVFRILPWREQILRGLLGADLIGFHTDAYRRHFSATLAQVLDAEVEHDTVRCDGRTVHLGAFPIGVDAEALDSRASSSDTARDSLALREGSGVEKLMLGVDRLDYTKGILRRFLAFERLLDRHPEWVGRVRLVQVAVPSRERLRAYEDFRTQVDVAASRINGRFGSVRGVPLHLLHRSVPLGDLIALYRAADVMTVTPLRDGMNLVAKEYCASRVDEDGVLVLSEFAGAAAELPESLVVNPYDLASTSEAMHEALGMQKDERSRRMRLLRARVLGSDVHAWASKFIRALNVCPVTPGVAPAPLPKEVMDRFGVAERVVVFLNYDGTLVPFAATPLLAAPDPALRELIRRLTSLPGLDVHFVSGRQRDTMATWFGDWPVSLHAEHGIWSKRDHEWSSLASGAFSWKRNVRLLLETFVARVPGTFVEEKSASLAWQYRGADRASVAEELPKLREVINREAATLGLQVLHGAKVLEVRADGVTKGVIVLRELAGSRRGTVFLAIGDDETDEDMFRALPGNAITVRVGAGPSAAAYRLAGVADVRALLAHLVAHRLASSRLLHDSRSNVP